MTEDYYDDGLHLYKEFEENKDFNTNDDISKIECRKIKTNFGGVVSAYDTSIYEYVIIERKAVEELVKKQRSETEVAELRAEINRIQTKLDNYVAKAQGSANALRRKKKLRKAEVIDLYSQGKTIPEIMETTGYSRTSVYQYLKEGADIETYNPVTFNGYGIVRKPRKKERYVQKTN